MPFQRKEAADETIWKFLRMSVEYFEYLLELVTPEIMKQDTRMRLAVTPRERLLITLRFLATADSYTSIHSPKVRDSLVNALENCIKKDLYSPDDGATGEMCSSNVSWTGEKRSLEVSRSGDGTSRVLMYRSVNGERSCSGVFGVGEHTSLDELRIGERCRVDVPATGENANR
uniref:Uncharacterized protein n=1 Tax=Anopheles christyi TaxID=43041 RepID=A0A182KFL2_9DIPT